MKIEKSAYAGMSNMMPSMAYAPKYTAFDMIPSKNSAIDVAGIENRWPEAYAGTEGKRLGDAGSIITRF